MAASTSVAVCVVTAAGRCHASMQWRCRAARGCPQAPAVASHVGTRSDAVPLRTALPCDRAAFCRTAFTAPARPGYVVSVCMSVCLVCLSCLSVRLSVCLSVWAVPSTPVRGCMPVEPRLYVPRRLLHVHRRQSDPPCLVPAPWPSHSVTASATPDQRQCVCATPMTD